MTYSVCALELTLSLDGKEFKKWKELAESECKMKYIHYDDEDINVLTNRTYYAEGLLVKYYDDIYRKKIKAIVNPCLMLGCGALELWKPKDGNIFALIGILGSLIDNYFDSEYGLNDFILTGINFAVDMDVGSSEAAMAYIRVFRKLNRVKGFSQKSNGVNSDDKMYGYDEEDSMFRGDEYEKMYWDDRDDKMYRGDEPQIKEHGFALSGNSNGIEFSVFNKDTVLRKRRDWVRVYGNKRFYDDSGFEAKTRGKGVLRAEVRLVKQRSIRKYTKEKVSSTAEQIAVLLGHCMGIFWDTLTDIIPFGEYIKLKDAECLVNSSPFKKNQKLKMLRLMRLVHEKKSLLLAQKELGVRNVDAVMDWFAVLNLSPVTISKRQKVKYLRNLYSYLEVKKK